MHLRTMRFCSAPSLSILLQRALAVLTRLPASQGLHHPLLVRSTTSPACCWRSPLIYAFLWPWRVVAKPLADDNALMPFRSAPPQHGTGSRCFGLQKRFLFVAPHVNFLSEKRKEEILASGLPLLRLQARKIQHFLFSYPMSQNIQHL